MDALRQLSAWELAALFALGVAWVPTEALIYRAFLPSLGRRRGSEAHLFSNVASQLLPPPSANIVQYNHFRRAGYATDDSRLAAAGTFLFPPIGRLALPSVAPHPELLQEVLGQLRSRFPLPGGPTTLSTTSSIIELSTPSPIPTLSANSPSLIAPTSLGLVGALERVRPSMPPLDWRSAPSGSGIAGGSRAAPPSPSFKVSARRSAPSNSAVACGGAPSSQNPDRGGGAEMVAMKVHAPKNAGPA